MKMWTRFQGFCNFLSCLIPFFFFFYSSTFAICVCATVGVWEIAALVLFGQCECALRCLYPFSAEKFLCSACFNTPPPPCVCLEYYNVCGSRNGASQCSFPHPVRRNKMRHHERYPALPFSDNSSTPHVQRRAPALELLFLSPAHP